MGKTFKDQQRYDDRKKLGKGKFPRVPPITKRSEPFEDKRKKSKYEVDLLEEYRQDVGMEGEDDH